MISDFSWYRGNLDWIQGGTLFLTRHGSHAYGTNLPTSDEDYKGICIPPREYFLGFLNHFEQAEARTPDIVIYDVRKFFKLAADCNPNIIEVLFTDEADWVISSDWWHRIREHRLSFLSKRAMHTFSGYAMSQLKRIKTHRRWLLDPPKKHPERPDFGLPESTTLAKEQAGVIEAKIRKLEDSVGGLGFTKDRIEGVDEQLVAQAVAGMEISPNLIPVIVAERRYNAAMRNWVQFQTWKAERNAARADLERKYGYDTKHGMHLVRLMRMATEILVSGEVRVKRPDADELLAIRAGAWPFDHLMTWASATEADLAAKHTDCTLPREPDRHFLDGILVAVVEDFMRYHPSR